MSFRVVRGTQRLTSYGSFGELNVSLPMGRSGNSTSHFLWVVRGTQRLTSYGSFGELNVSLPMGRSTGSYSIIN
ncbi:hypothetical protein [Leptospira interrogans]|uniref:hypothetical protein n=1 Tax=Leptospira interrogans TaxID=173 RepID=UPI0012FA44B4|nr:hypothetical protein [Leptospira interrogans]